MTLATRLLRAFPSSLPWPITGAAAMDASLSVVYAGSAIDVVTGGVTRETGYKPDAGGTYGALWTRDHAYVLWHNPTLLTAAQRREFVTYTLSRRTDGSESDPDGGTLPADWIADRIAADGTATFKNAGASDLPFMDGIAFVVLALWTDWNLTGDLTTYTASKAAIDSCLAAIPRSASGCVYSDPAAPSVDYGFTDTVKKTGDVAYGTALLAWAYRMMGEMADDGSYDAAFADACAGLATLRRANGFYKGSSVNNATVDDVWATALAVAEGLVSGTDRYASANAIRSAYLDGTTEPHGYYSTITQFGLVRHLPVGQFWTGTATTQGTYQNGGYWATPVWDCVRAVDLVDPATARVWAAEFIAHTQDEYDFEQDWSHVPWEWHNHDVGFGAKGYTASAAVVRRFT